MGGDEGGGGRDGEAGYQALRKHKRSYFNTDLAGEEKLSGRKDGDERDDSGRVNSKLAAASKVRERVTPLKDKQTNKLGMAGA